MGARATLSERTKRIHIQYKHLKSIAELGVDLVASILHERRVHGDSVVIWSMINSARPFVRFVGGNGVPWLRDQTLWCSRARFVSTADHRQEADCRPGCQAVRSDGRLRGGHFDRVKEWFGPHFAVKNCRPISVQQRSPRRSLPPAKAVRAWQAPHHRRSGIGSGRPRPGHAQSPVAASRAVLRADRQPNALRPC